MVLISCTRHLFGCQAESCSGNATASLDMVEQQIVVTFAVAIGIRTSGKCLQKCTRSHEVATALKWQMFLLIASSVNMTTGLGKTAWCMNGKMSRIRKEAVMSRTRCCQSNYLLIKITKNSAIISDYLAENRNRPILIGSLALTHIFFNMVFI